MGSGPVVKVEAFDTMTPQERADAVRSGVVHSWEAVDPSARQRIEAKAAEIERHAAQAHRDD